MNEQELIQNIQKVKKLRLLSRVLIIAALALLAVLYAVGVELKILCIAFVVFCAAIVFAIGFPTQRKLSIYEEQLKKLEDAE